MYWKSLNQTISWIYSKPDGVVFSHQLILSVAVLVCLPASLFFCLFFCWCVTQSGDQSHTTNACLMDPHLLATGSKYCLFQSAPLFFNASLRNGGWGGYLEVFGWCFTLIAWLQTVSLLTMTLSFVIKPLLSDSSRLCMCVRMCTCTHLIGTPCILDCVLTWLEFSYRARWRATRWAEEAGGKWIRE